MQYDLIAVGDTVVDNFIRLKEATIRCGLHDPADHGATCELCIAWGTKVPYDTAQEIAAVGNAPNGAASSARLGLKTAIITSVGNDENGKKCLDAFKENNVSTELISVVNELHTNYHFVLWYQEDRTILIRHEAFPYVMPVMEQPRWIYWSSLRQGSEAFHDEFATYLEANPDVQFAFQPGIFEIRMGAAKLATMYKHSAVVVCNKEEAQQIVGSESEDLKTLLTAMRALGPKIAVITDGPKGAYAMSDEGAWFMPIYPDPAPPYERTGAGDAFASTLTVALALGMHITDALRWAPINSMAVVQKVGAQAGLLTRAELEAWLAKAPADYQPRPLP
jgi:sugar/nucleoside kinase (ribokinase family)